MSKKLLLLILLAIILSLSYCTLWVAGYSHIEQIEDDEHVGKTLLIYHKAGEFMPSKSWYFGKRSGDSYFSYSPPYPEGDAPPIIYRLAAKYRIVNHGGNLLSGSGYDRYLLESFEEKANKRLFLSSLFLCKEQTDLFDQDTNIKIDFVCD